MGAIKMTWKSNCRIELYSQVKYYSAFGKSCPLKRRVTAPRPRELYSLGGLCLTKPTGHLVFSSGRRDVSG